MDAAEDLARQWHEAYEALAPSFDALPLALTGPWDQLPDNHRRLLVAVCRILLSKLRSDRDAGAQTVAAEARMWQHKTGALISLIEDHGDDTLTERMLRLVNVNWYTGAEELERGWDAAARAAFQAALQAASESGLLPEAADEAE